MSSVIEVTNSSASYSCKRNNVGGWGALQGREWGGEGAGQKRLRAEWALPKPTKAAGQHAKQCEEGLVHWPHHGSYSRDEDEHDLPYHLNQLPPYRIRFAATSGIRTQSADTT